MTEEKNNGKNEGRKDASFGNWDEDFKNDDSNNSDKNTERRKASYLTFDKSGNYTIRLVGNYVKFLRHWKPFDTKDRVITDTTYKGKDPAWNAGFYPRTTFAIHVIDRADGKLKILEKGKQIFGEFARYRTINDVNPAGKEAPDFVITVKIPPANKRATQYSVTPKGNLAALTDKEVELVKKDHYPLAEMYKSTPLEKIKELWEKLPDEKKVPPKKEEKEDGEKDNSEKSTKEEPRVSREAPAPEEKSASDDDLFDEEKTASSKDNSAELF